MTGVRARWAVLLLLAVAAVLAFASSSTAMQAVALLCLAAVPASVAVPRWWRVPLGVLVAGAAVAVLLTAPGTDVAAVSATVAAVVAGGLLTWRGPRWGRMTMRYSQQTKQRGGSIVGNHEFGTNTREEADTEDPRELWNALSRGEDPTSRRSSTEVEANRESNQTTADGSSQDSAPQ